jgi:hypothetical protein
MPPGRYRITELELGLTENNVLLRGSSSGLAYGPAYGGTELYSDAGRWAVWFHNSKLTANGNFCGMENVNVLSNGAGPGTGVEYGVIVSCARASLRGVNINGFQHGLAAWGLNSNRFEQCSFSYNTRIGFAVMEANPQAAAYQYPTLYAHGISQEEYVGNSIFSCTACTIRRNQIGVVVRGGAGGLFVEETVIESNNHQAFIGFDSSRTKFVDVHFENNNTDTAAVTDVNGYHALRSGPGSEYLKGSSTGVYGRNDLGCDILIGESAESRSIKPEDHQTSRIAFNRCSWSKGAHTRRGLRVRSGYRVLTRDQAIEGQSSLFWDATPASVKATHVDPQYRYSGGGMDSALGTGTVVAMTNP